MKFFRERRVAQDQERIMSVLRRHRTESFDMLELSRLARTKSVPILALARLEDDGRITGEFENGPGPRRRVYRLADA